MTRNYKRSISCLKHDYSVIFSYLNCSKHYKSLYCRFYSNYPILSNSLSFSKQRFTLKMTDQYQPIYEVTEWVEDYKNGGLHPIHIGDYLSKGRYKIIRKLGYGAFSTVWLAKDYRYFYVILNKLFIEAKITRDTTIMLPLRYY